MKITGQELKNDYVATETRLNNLTHKITKKFDLIINNYQKCLTEEDKKFLQKTFIHTISIENKLGIIIRTEDNYINLTGRQGSLF